MTKVTKEELIKELIKELDAENRYSHLNTGRLLKEEIPSDENLKKAKEELKAWCCSDKHYLKIINIMDELYPDTPTDSEDQNVEETESNDEKDSEDQNVEETESNDEKDSEDQNVEETESNDEKDSEDQNVEETESNDEKDSEDQNVEETE